MEIARQAQEELDKQLKNEEIRKAEHAKQAREDLKEWVKNKEIWKAKHSKGEQGRDELRKENEASRQENGYVRNEFEKLEIDRPKAEQARDDLK